MPASEIDQPLLENHNTFTAANMPVNRYAHLVPMAPYAYLTAFLLIYCANLGLVFWIVVFIVQHYGYWAVEGDRTAVVGSGY